MPNRLTPSTIFLLVLAQLLWAGNAVLGRALQHSIPPITLNFLRWLLALLFLLPAGGWVLRRQSGLWPHWRRFALLGLLGVGCYNSLQYLALKTSSPINVTLVAASIPIWMMTVGWLFYGQKISQRQVAGALLSIAGVLTVLCRGEWLMLAHLQWVAGDLYVLIATLAWAFYSWQLSNPNDPPAIRSDWTAFLVAQIAFGTLWSGLFASAEWAFTPAHIEWSWTLGLALLYIAIGPALVAYRCWGLGVQRVGPTVAGFFANLSPLFAALLSAAFLGEPPHLYHVFAFVLIVGGIVVSARR